MHYAIFIGFDLFIKERTHLMSKSKTFQELNLVDGFLFGASTENPEDAEYIAKVYDINPRSLWEK